MRKYKGFSLLELMIVITIISILMSVAIPKYSSYIARAQITNIFSQVAPIKSSVNEAIIYNNDSPAEADYRIPIKIAASVRTADQNYSVIDFNSRDGSFGINIGNNKGLGIVKKSDAFVYFRPLTNHGFITWSCIISDDVPSEIMPIECR